MTRRRHNPFNVAVKGHGRSIERIGPTTEADIWIEEVPTDRVPLTLSADPTWEELGQAIRERRQQLGYTLVQLSILSGVSRSGLHDIEIGKRTRPVTIKAVADALGAYVYGSLPEQKNPGLSRQIRDQYRVFHGVEPTVIEVRGWVPGKMTRVGRGIDISYGIIDKRSNKDGAYLHDHLPGVRVYRRRRGRGRVDFDVKQWPGETWALGENLGLTYQDDKGQRWEVDPSDVLLCWVSSLRALVVIETDTGDVEFLCKGGGLEVTDWIRG